MPTFSNLHQLEEYVKKQVEDVIRHEVFEVVRDEWLETQWDRVYLDYEPNKYKRREDNGGLNDPKNIEMKEYVSKDLTSFVMENVAKGAGWDEWSGKLINDMIEGSSLFAGDPARNMPARPYTQETVDDLTHGVSRNIVLQALKDGLRRRGLDIEIR